jgi:hypothetical protein
VRARLESSWMRRWRGSTVPHSRNPDELRRARCCSRCPPTGHRSLPDASGTLCRCTPSRPTATRPAPDRPGAGREPLQRYGGDRPQLLVPRDYKAVELYAAIGPSPPKPSTQAAVQIGAARRHGLARARLQRSRIPSRPEEQPTPHTSGRHGVNHVLTRTSGRTDALCSSPSPAGARRPLTHAASRQLRCRVGPGPTRTGIDS